MPGNCSSNIFLKTGPYHTKTCLYPDLGKQLRQPSVSKGMSSSFQFSRGRGLEGLGVQREVWRDLLPPLPGRRYCRFPGFSRGPPVIHSGSVHLPCPETGHAQDAWTNTQRRQRTASVGEALPEGESGRKRLITGLYKYLSNKQEQEGSGGEGGKSFFFFFDFSPQF